MKKALIYCRISTPKNDPLSRDAIAPQRDVCLQFIEESGTYVLAQNGIYCDQPNPKIKTLTPEFKRMLRRLTVAKEIRAVVTYSPDRLSRNFQHFTVLRATLEARGVELINVETSPEQAFALTLFDALREFSSKSAGSKIKRALARKKAPQ